MTVSRWLRAVLVPLAVAAAGCSLPTDSQVDPAGDTPASSGGTATSGPTPVLGAPSASPSPSPATPDSGAAPSPQPTPPPSPGCALPASSPATPVCTDEPGRLLDSVEAAISRVTQARPSLFNLNDTRCDGCYKVLDVKAYYAAVQRELAARGICSYTDYEEVAAKDSNAASEHFDILLASDHIRRGPGVYRGVCRPAIF